MAHRIVIMLEHCVRAAILEANLLQAKEKPSTIGQFQSKLWEQKWPSLEANGMRCYGLMDMSHLFVPWKIGRFAEMPDKSLAIFCKYCILIGLRLFCWK